MAKPTEQQIALRAYKMWEENNKPEGRNEELYRQAEKELEENDKDGVGPEPTVL
jgi:DUF2934 family protein